jgi:hypothetical protein
MPVKVNEPGLAEMDRRFVPRPARIVKFVSWRSVMLWRFAAIADTRIIPRTLVGAENANTHGRLVLSKFAMGSPF